MCAKHIKVIICFIDVDMKNIVNVQTSYAYLCPTPSEVLRPFKSQERKTSALPSIYLHIFAEPLKAQQRDFNIAVPIASQII